MGFVSLADIAQAEEAGRYHYGAFCKLYKNFPNAVGHDTSGFSGIPQANYYASNPLIAKAMNEADGIYHGGNVASGKKYLNHITLCNAESNSGTFHKLYDLLDYLVYYPFVEGDNSDEQIMDNTVTLPRYADGVGLRLFCVAQSSYIGGGNMVVKYIDSNDVQRNTISLVVGNALSPSAGCFPTNNAMTPLIGNFIPLVNGIKRVVSVTFTGSNGGVFCFVICKRILSAFNACQWSTANATRSIGITDESMIATRRYMPEILNQACLGFIGSSTVGSGTQTKSMIGNIKTVWSN